jgi:hypothetical protein
MLSGGNSINHFDFINSNIGFASSTALNSFQVYSKIYKTIDGGFHWIAISNNDSIEEMYDIAFQDEFVGFCVGKDTLHNSANYPSILYKTTDGGSSWVDYLGALFVTPNLTNIEFIGIDSFITVGFYDESFMDNGTIWLNFSDTNLQWFSEDFTADTLSPKVYKNDVLEYNNCIYILGDNGFLATNCKIDTDKNNVAILEVKNQINLNLYPNPAKGFMYFEFENKIKNVSLELYDLTGKLQQKTIAINSNKIKIEKNNLLSGMYLFKIYSEGNELAFGKLIFK